MPEFGKRKHEGHELVVHTLPVAKMGQPLLLGKDLDKKVQNYLFSLRDVGGVINTAIVRAVAASMVKKKDPRLLAVNGKGLDKLYAAMDWICKNFEEEKHQFLFDIKVIVAIEEVPPCLESNWNQICVCEQLDNGKTGC